jgi:double-stranded uracil-DNA glycosylase
MATRTPARRAATRRPTREELEASATKRVKDVIGPGLRVLFCGINPGLWTSYTGHHFAGPGNRFWKALYAGGLTPRVLKPAEKSELLDYHIGITNVVARATATAAELGAAEYVAGGKRLVAKLRKYEPRALAVLGLGAYRAAFGHAAAKVGEQADRIGKTRVWVMPNPSGLNQNYSLEQMGEMFAELREAVGLPDLRE